MYKRQKEEGIPIIAYDRLLTKTEAVDYYATFDNYAVGKLQGEYIVDTLDLENQPELYFDSATYAREAAEQFENDRRFVRELGLPKQ